MKRNIYKSKIMAFAGCFAILFTISSCIDEDIVEYSATEASQVIADPSVQVGTPVISFQAGTSEYEIAFKTVNGTKGLTQINLYSTFTDAGSGLDSDAEALLKSYTVTDPLLQEFSDMFTYDQFKAGLTVGGAALPTDDRDLAIGSGWTIRMEATYADGSTGNLGTINVGVLHRFAGLYKVLESEYYRIDVGPNADWTGSERFIGSVDANTFSHPNFWGNFSWTGSEFHFDVDFDNANAITYSFPDGLFSGTYTINCTDDAALFDKVPCAGQNVVIADDVTGKHIIKLTYGYFNVSGDENEGEREFYEILEKIVD